MTFTPASSQAIRVSKVLATQRPLHGFIPGYNWADVFEYIEDSRNGYTEQVAALIADMYTSGQDMPIILDGDGHVVDGVLRLYAAVQLGWHTIFVAVDDDWYFT